MTESPSSGMQGRLRLFAVLWLGCLLFLSGVTLADPDLWGHTLYGLRSMELGVLTERTDPYSYTAAGLPWVNHEWLTELVYAACWHWGGDVGLVAWRNLVLVLLWLLAWASLAPGLRTGEVSLAAAFLLVVFATECLANYVVFVRPQLATYVGTLGTVLLLRRQWDRLTPAIWLVPLGMVLWTNLHGGFLAGVAFTGLFAASAVLRGRVDAARRRETWTWLAVGSATLLATLVNPYGAGLHRMLWEHLVTPQLVLEWQPIWSATPSVMYAAPFLVAGLALVWSRPWAWIDLALLLATGWQAASHVRHVALLALVVLALLPAALTEALERLFPQLHESWGRREAVWWRWTATTLVLGFLLGLHVRGCWEMWGDGVRPWQVAVETRSGVPGVPVNAVREMQRRGLAGNLATDYGWGQFVVWHLWPEVKVAFDGRYRTVYPLEVEREFVDLQTAGAQGKTSTPLLDRYSTQWVLAPREGGLARSLSARPDWEMVYRDPQAVLFAPRQLGLAMTTERNVEMPFRTRRWVRFPG